MMAFTRPSVCQVVKGRVAIVACAAGTSASSIRSAHSAATRFRPPLPAIPYLPPEPTSAGRPSQPTPRDLPGWGALLPGVRPRRRPRELELDAVGIEEEDRVVALAV